MKRSPLFAFVAVLVIMGGVGYFFGTREEREDTPAVTSQDIAEPGSLVHDVGLPPRAGGGAPLPETQGTWTEYRSPYGFSFRYPAKTFTIKATSESFPLAVSPYSTVGGQVLYRESGYQVGEECFLGESGIPYPCPTEVAEIGFFPLGETVKFPNPTAPTPYGGPQDGTAILRNIEIGYRDVSVEGSGRFEYYVPMKNGGTIIITRPFKSETERRDLYNMLFNQVQFQKSANPWAKLFYQIWNTLVF